MAVYVVPTAAGHCRMITRFVKNKKNYPSRPGLMGLFLKVRLASCWLCACRPWQGSHARCNCDAALRPAARTT